MAKLDRMLPKGPERGCPIRSSRERRQQTPNSRCFAQASALRPGQPYSSISNHLASQNLSPD